MLTRELTAELLLVDIYSELSRYRQAAGNLLADARHTGNERNAGYADGLLFMLSSLQTIRQRLELGQRVLGLIEPSLANDENILNRPWTEK